MLYALLDGRALPAGELAYAASVTAQTASSHLAKLCDGGLLVREAEGRHRHYRLAGPHVAQAIEQLATIHPAVPARRKPLTLQARAICFARCCYDHLAGRLGVAVTEALEGRGFITPAEDKRINSFCGAQPTRKLRWMNAWLGAGVASYGDFSWDVRSVG